MHSFYKIEKDMCRLIHTLELDSTLHSGIQYARSIQASVI